MKIFSRAIKIFTVLFLVLGLAAASAETVQERASRLAQKSLELRKQPPRTLNAEEHKAQVLIKQAEDLSATVESASEVDAVIALFQTAAKTAPGYDEAWIGLASALCRRVFFMPAETAREKAEILKYLDQAKAACNRALAINPMSPGANYWMSNILITEVNFRNPALGLLRIPQILSYSDKVEQVDPYYEYGAIYRTYGMAISLMPDWMIKTTGYSPAMILPYLDQALKMEPNCFSNRTVRAFMLNKLGEKERALADLEYVRSHDPALLPSYQADNRLRQKDALVLWKMFTGKSYPEK